MNHSGLDLLAQATLQRALNTVLVGVLVTALVWTVLRLVRPSSKARFAIWFSTLVGVVTLTAIPRHTLSTFANTVVSSDAAGLTLSGSWATLLLSLWAIGCGVFLLRLGVGFWRIRELSRNNLDVENGADDEVQRRLREFARSQRVRVCVNDRIRVPSAMGFLRPAIVIPAWMLSQVTPEELEAILFHEQAHLRRGDHWTNLLQQLVKAVFFFHPAVWWIESNLALEREMACDESVLAMSGGRDFYASSLVSLAEKLQRVRGLRYVQAFVARVGELSLRVSRILEGTPRRGRSWGSVLVTGAALLGAFAVTPLLPEMIRFQDEPIATQAPKIQSPALPAAVRETRAHAEQAVLRTPAKPLWVAATRERPARPAVARNVRTHRPPVVVPGYQVVVSPVREQGMIVVIDTSVSFDAAPSAVWTVWMWSVEEPGTGVVRPRVQPAIIVHLI